MTGQIEMVQQSEYELTNVEVDFKGLIDNSGYHVHIVSFSLHCLLKYLNLFKCIFVLLETRRRLKEI